MKMLSIIFVSLLSLGTASVAQQPEQSQPPIPPVRGPSIQGYGDADASCRRWADGCRACDRDANGAPVCSNIGIACQPKEIECTARKEEQTPPK